MGLHLLNVPSHGFLVRLTQSIEHRRENVNCLKRIERNTIRRMLVELHPTPESRGSSHAEAKLLRSLTRQNTGQLFHLTLVAGIDTQTTWRMPKELHRAPLGSSE